MQAFMILLSVVELEMIINNDYNNIPRACFLDRSPVPAVDKKSSRSDL